MFDGGTDELLNERSVDLAAGAEHSIDGLVSIGGDYTLRATVGDERDESTWVVCYCYSERADVGVQDGVPTVESRRLVCE